MKGKPYKVRLWALVGHGCGIWSGAAVALVSGGGFRTRASHATHIMHAAHVCKTCKRQPGFSASRANQRVVLPLPLAPAPQVKLQFEGRDKAALEKAVDAVREQLDVFTLPA